VEYAPKGRYAERLPEGHPGDNGSFRSGYQFMYDEAGNETGWTNCSTFTTDQVMADAGYNIDKQMTVNGVEASLTDFANNRLLHSNSADVDIRTLQGDLETPVFQTVDDYYDARAEDSVLTDGLAGALVNAVDEDGQALGQYLPNREGDRDHRQADLNFIRPGDALQTYKGRKEGGTRGHSVIVSQVVGRDKDGREVTLTGEEDPMILEGFVVTDVSYLSANADNQQGQVLTDVSKTVDEMYDEYTGLIAARPRYNDYGSIGFEQGEDGSYQEIEVGAETLQDAIPNPVHVDVDGQRVPQ